MSKAIRLSSQDFKVLNSCKSKEEYRRNLSGFHITKDYIETTDGHKLVRVPLNESNLVEDLYLHGTSMDHVITTDDTIYNKSIEIPKTLKVNNNQYIVLSTCENNIVTAYVVSDVNQVISTVYLPIIDAGFPDTSQAIPDYSNSTLEVGIGIKELKDIVNAYPGKGALKITFLNDKEMSLSPMEIKYDTGENIYSYVLMPMRV